LLLNLYFNNWLLYLFLFDCGILFLSFLFLLGKHWRSLNRFLFFLLLNFSGLLLSRFILFQWLLLFFLLIILALWNLFLLLLIFIDPTYIVFCFFISINIKICINKKHSFAKIEMKTLIKMNASELITLNRRASY
jgi:hypothetical protein